MVLTKTWICKTFLKIRVCLPRLKSVVDYCNNNSFSLIKQFHHLEKTFSFIKDTSDQNPDVCGQRSSLKLDLVLSHTILKLFFLVGHS